MEKELLYKNRSFSSCINAAYKLQIENLKNIFKCTWLPVLVLSILIGCYTLLPSVHPMVAPPAAGLPLTHLLMFFGILILQILALSWFLSRLMSLLNEKSRQWNFKRALWMQIGNLIITLVFVSIFSTAAGVAAGYYQAKAAADEAATSTPTAFFVIMGVYALLMLLFICLVELPLIYTSMRYMNDEKMKFWKDLLHCHRIGLRHWGFIFITLLLASIIMSIIIIVLMTPSSLLSFARYTSETGVVAGDPSGMPSYFGILQFVTSAVVSFLTFQVIIFEVLVIYFMYGSIETQEKERKSTNQIAIPDEMAEKDPKGEINFPFTGK